MRTFCESQSKTIEMVASLLRNVIPRLKPGENETAGRTDSFSLCVQATWKTI